MNKLSDRLKDVYVERIAVSDSESEMIPVQTRDLKALLDEVAQLERRLAEPIKLPPKMRQSMAGDKHTRTLFGGVNMGINDCAKVLLELGFNVVGYPV